MGFNASDLKFLLSGMNGTKLCTLGRLNLFLSQAEARTISGKPITLPSRAILFAEDLLSPLGYDVTSIDASSYEGANIVHDLNKPIPAELVEKFDIVWDGGTLEHIFDFPAALTNAMRMVKIGGHFAMRTPANNQCGHGFYQFSPELFFRILVPPNGFELVRLYLASRGKFYHVKDPTEAHNRVELLDNAPAMLMVHARKISQVPDQVSIPQQSDYVEVWDDAAKPDGRLKAVLRSHLSEQTIAKISILLNKLRQRRAVAQWKQRSRLSNADFYRPVERWDQPTRDAWRG